MNLVSRGFFACCTGLQGMRGPGDGRLETAGTHGNSRVRV
jgi:hypothetical protein